MLLINMERSDDMNNAMMAFGWAGIMMLIGVICRAKIGFFGNILMPASVIGGIIGFILMNTGVLDVDPNLFSQIVGVLFTISFISIGLTSSPKEDKSKGSSTAKDIYKGSMGMGLLWNGLYGLTPLLAALVMVVLFNKFLPIYGIVVPFAFCQGPGQSAVFGATIEGYGIPDVAQVAITYAALGFLIAFSVGVPLAKYGMKKGLALYPTDINDSVKRGLFKANEQTQSVGKSTTYNGNIDTLAFHFALVALCYVMAVYMGKLELLLIPGLLGETLSTFTFINGMLAGYIVKFVMKKFKAEEYHDSTLQARITGWSTDLLICMAFMAIQVSIVAQYFVPIITVAIITAIVTAAVILYFVPRIGGPCDFERVLGLFGCATGTVPSGLALIRIVDPDLKTTAPTELGAMNLIMMAHVIVVTAILGYSSGVTSFTSLLITMAVFSLVNFALLKVFRVWGKKSFDLRTGVVYDRLAENKKSRLKTAGKAAETNA